MTHAQALHMVAAAVLPPPEHLRELYARLRGQLNAVPCAPRRETLEVARQSFRLVEYYEARHGELPLLADILDRAKRGQSTERQVEQLDAYWRRMADWIRALGVNEAPLSAPPLPPPPAWFETSELWALRDISSSLEASP